MWRGVRREGVCGEELGKRVYVERSEERGYMWRGVRGEDMCGKRV